MDEQNKNVFDFLQNRIITHYPAAMKILQREMPAPRTAIVYPTYICNQDCLWCEYGAENTEHHSIMPDKDFRRLIGDLDELGVRGVEFCGGGEPTLHPMLTQIIRDMRERKMSVGILTNGTKLYGELAQVLAEYASYVRIGFDGATKETFHRVKRPRSPEAGYDAVCTNMKNLVSMRNQLKSKCRVSMKVVVDQNNMHEVAQCAELAVELSADSVQFKAARLCESELDAEQTLAINGVIEQCKVDFAGKVAVIGGMEKIDTATQCWLTPLQLVVDTLGEVYLCCYYRHRKDSHSIGNCFTDPLDTLWYSQRHWDSIDGIKPHECNNLDCRFVKYNDIMSELLVKRDAQFEFI